MIYSIIEDEMNKAYMIFRKVHFDLAMDAYVVMIAD